METRFAEVKNRCVVLQSNLSLDLANTSISDLKTVGAMLELSRAKAAAAAAAANSGRSGAPAAAAAASRAQHQLLAVAQQQLLVEKVARSLQQEGLLADNAARSMQQQQQQDKQQLQHLQQQLHHQQMQQQQQLQQQQQQQQQQQLQQQQLQQQQQIHIQLQQLQQQQKHHHQAVSSSVTDHKLADFLRANLENVENITGSTKVSISHIKAYSPTILRGKSYLSNEKPIEWRVCFENRSSERVSFKKRSTAMQQRFVFQINAFI